MSSKDSDFSRICHIGFVSVCFRWKQKIIPFDWETIKYKIFLIKSWPVSFIIIGFRIRGIKKDIKSYKKLWKVVQYRGWYTVWYTHTLIHSVFSLIIWITKLQIKQRVERPQQILANYGHISWKLSNCSDHFSRLSVFPDLSGKAFLITFKFS